MLKITLVEYINRHWSRFEVYKDDDLLCELNKFAEVKDNFIIEYDAIGGHDNPKKGDIIKKISIKDCEFEHVRKR